MTFDQPWALLPALIPLLWFAAGLRRRGGRSRLALKAVALAAVALALAEPRLETIEQKVAAVILADTSASLAHADLERASSIANAIEEARGRNWTRVIPFARETRRPAPTESGDGWQLAYSGGEAGRGSDLEAALRHGMAALPAGMVPRIVLISDGQENLGSAARAAWQARLLGIPIDTYALPGRVQPQLRLESAGVPTQAFSGERFSVDLSVVSPQAASARVTLRAEGKVIGSNEVELAEGANLVRAQARLTTAGAIELAAELDAGSLGELRFSQALDVRRPEALVISDDPPGTEQHLRAMLQEAQFDVTFRAGEDWSDLASYQIVVLNNWDLLAMPPARQSALEEFVKEGGGLLVIGGERNRWVEKKGPEDPLIRALPARIAPPRTPEGTCVVLIMDKSSSMEGKKMELARLAAIGVIENLRPIDLLGVLIFDNSFHWTVPIRRAQNPLALKRLVAGITPDGGTQIAPALAEAYRRILPVNSIYKHIVLLTDGISEEGDSIGLSREAGNNRVTISTVGLGQDVNRAYLEKVAVNAGGKAYFLRDPSGLEQILLRDVMEHTGTTAVEKPVKPVVIKQAEILADVGMENAPTLSGYVRFEAKPGADTILSIERRDPLYVRWQYGLGRAAVFTSDAKSRWASEWVAWSGFDRFWSNVFRDLLPHAQAGEAVATYDSANDELVVDYRLAPHVEEPRRAPDIYVLSGSDFRRAALVTKVADRAYQARAALEGRRGFFRIRPLEESRAFPEAGCYRQEEELSQYGSNEPLLRELSRFTGGRFQPAPGDVFDAGGRAIPTSLRLWPALLALAILLNLAEVVLRKWPGIVEFLRARRGSRAVPA